MENKNNKEQGEKKELVKDDKVKKNLEGNEDNVDELSVEEFEEEDIDYYDEGLIDNEVLENLKNFEIEIDKEKTDKLIETHLNDFKREYENFDADGEIYSITVNAKGVIAVGDGADMTYLYDLNKKELIKKEKFNKDSVVCVAFSKDYKYLASASLDGSVNIFNGDNFKVLNTVNGSYSDINWLQWHPKGPVFAFGCTDASIWVYHAINTNNTMSFFGHTETVSCGSFTHDGKYLISGSDDNTIKVWDLKNQCLLHTIKGIKFHQSAITTLSVAKKKNIIATGSVENELAVSNYENGNILALVKAGQTGHSLEAVEFCNDDRYILFSGNDHNLQVLDLMTMQIRFKIPFHTESIVKITSSLLYSSIVYMSGSNGNFFVFDVRGNGEICQKEKAHSDVLIDFVMTKGEEFAVTCSLDKTINLVQVIKI